MILAEAHERLSKYVPEDQRVHYWKKPGVWNDIKESFESFYAKNPGSTNGHSTYARYAYWCEQRETLREQLRLLTYTNYTYLGGTQEFSKMVRWASEDAVDKEK